VKTARIVAALVMAFLFVSPGIGSTWEQDPVVGLFPPSCTSARQKCMDKLEQLQLFAQPQDWTRVESVLFKLRETDPECAMLLQGEVLYGF